jgi:iron complex transport system ATP-binding protein
MPIIEIDNYSYSIGDNMILRDVSFEVAEGEYLSIIGPNGAGKTTLLKCIDRIYRGGRGAIRILGKPLESYSQKELARLISYVPQADERLFPFTAREFVLMGRYPHLSPFSSVRPEDLEEVDRVMELTSTRGFAHRNVAEESARRSSLPLPWPRGRRSSCWTNPPPSSIQGTRGT